MVPVMTAVGWSVRPPGVSLLSSPGGRMTSNERRKEPVSTQQETDHWLDEQAFTNPESEIFTPNDDYEVKDLKDAPDPAGDDDADWVPGKTLLEAPDYGTMVRGKRTAKSKRYEAKSQSVLKMGAL